MTLKDLLRKKEKIGADAQHAQAAPPAGPALPEFKFIRTTTNLEEVIQPPIYPGDDDSTTKTSRREGMKRLSLGFRKSSSASITNDPPAANEHDSSSEKSTQQLPVRPKAERKLSDRLHLHRDRPRSGSAESSSNLPDNLPEAPVAVPLSAGGDGTVEDTKGVKEQREAEWENRATILAQGNPLVDDNRHSGQQQEKLARVRDASPGVVSNAQGDENIQEAIRLHEAGDLEPSTAMFGRLADPTGANNALAQILYGLALRHGWGITPEPEKAVRYLSLAASNSASIEEQALASGLQKGGAAKGELVLAIFELANCFRQGLGVKKDAVAARQYYETAANLGDTDAMEEAAWCYLEGFGGGKDKFKAAQYLRLAEEKGHKTVGNSWIWKDKYNPK